MEGDNPYLSETARGFMVSVLEQLNEVGWNHVEHLSQDLKEITLLTSHETDPGRYLRLKLVLTADFPHRPPHIDFVDLPEVLSFKWNNESRLCSLYEAFKSQLSTLQPLMRMLSELDREAWVIDPEYPSGRDLHRRIMIQQPEVTANVVFDPDAIDRMPDVQLLGVDKYVQPLRQRIRSHCSKYDPELGIVLNLERILNVELPRKPEDTMDTEAVICEICFIQRLGGQLPDKACNSCGKQFHQTCLFECLLSMPDTIRTCNFVRGKCSVCNAAIACDEPST